MREYHSSTKKNGGEQWFIHHRELFRATQRNKYKETIDPIMPGRGLPEKMFEGSQHAANYMLDTRLTFKVNK